MGVPNAEGSASTRMLAHLAHRSRSCRDFDHQGPMRRSRCSCLRRVCVFALMPIRNCGDGIRHPLIVASRSRVLQALGGVRYSAPGAAYRVSRPLQPPVGQGLCNADHAPLRRSTDFRSTRAISWRIRIACSGPGRTRENQQDQGPVETEVLRHSQKLASRLGWRKSSNPW